MSLSRRDKTKRPEITVSNFYAKQVFNNPAWPWFTAAENGFKRMRVFASKKAIKQ